MPIRNVNSYVSDVNYVNRMMIGSDENFNNYAELTVISPQYHKVFQATPHNIIK